MLCKDCIHYGTRQRGGDWWYAYCFYYSKWESGKGTRDLCLSNCSDCPQYRTKESRWDEFGYVADDYGDDE